MAVVEAKQIPEDSEREPKRTLSPGFHSQKTRSNCSLCEEQCYQDHCEVRKVQNSRDCGEREKGKAACLSRPVQLDFTQHSSQRIQAFTQYSSRYQQAQQRGNAVVMR